MCFHLITNQTNAQRLQIKRVLSFGTDFLYTIPINASKHHQNAISWLSHCWSNEMGISYLYVVIASNSIILYPAAQLLTHAQT